MNIQAMMKQAQQMQEKLQKQMVERRVEATAGELIEDGIRVKAARLAGLASSAVN